MSAIGKILKRCYCVELMEKVNGVTFSIPYTIDQNRFNILYQQSKEISIHYLGEDPWIVEKFETSDKTTIVIMAVPKDKKSGITKDEFREIWGSNDNFYLRNLKLCL